MISYSLFEKYPEITHFTTDREGGVSTDSFSTNNLSPYTNDNPTDFSENKRRLCCNLNISEDKLIIPFQTHGSEIRNIDDTFFSLTPTEKETSLFGVDALITQLPNVCLGITTADCVPLLFFDPTQKVIAAAHAGWRGTCDKIAERVVGELVKQYQCNANDILVTIGPSISVQSYNVGAELLPEFKKAGFEVNEIFEKRQGLIFLDLRKANKITLINAGISPDKIETSGICTFIEHKRFFSARYLGIRSGRMLSGILIQE